MERQRIGEIITMSTAARSNAGKLDPLVIHPDILAEMRRPIEYLLFMLAGTPGSIKYDIPNGTRLNYILGGKSELEYIQCATRHAMRIEAGELIDQELKSPHIAQIYWNIKVLQYMRANIGKSIPRTLPDHIKITCLSENTLDLVNTLHALGFLCEEKMDNAIQSCLNLIIQIAEKQIPEDKICEYSLPS